MRVVIVEPNEALYHKYQFRILTDLLTKLGVKNLEIRHVQNIKPAMAALIDGDFNILLTEAHLGSVSKFNTSDGPLIIRNGVELAETLRAVWSPRGWRAPAIIGMAKSPQGVFRFHSKSFPRAFEKHELEKIGPTMNLLFAEQQKDPK